MKFTYNGMEVECTVEEFMKIAGGSGGEAKDPVELDKEVIDKLFGMDEYHQYDHDPINQDPINPANNKTESEPDDGLPPCTKCCLCKVYCDTKEDRLCEDKDGTPCPNYNESGCAYRNGVLTKDLTEKLIFGEDKDENKGHYPCATCELCGKHSSLTCEDADGNTCPNYSEYGCAHENGVYEKYKEYNALVDEFKKDPRYLEKEESWPYDEAKRTFESIMEAGYLLTAVGIIIDETDDPGYEPGGIVIICPEVDGAYQVYDDAGYVMPVDDLVGFVRRAYHADINIYSPFEVIDNDFAQEIEDACTIVAAEEVEKLLKQR